MLKIVGCFTDSHDFWLVALAAFTCALAATTCIELLRHARKAAARMRAVWLVVTAVAGGSGIWATHFIAMLAFEPNLPSAYAIGLTGLSLVYAITLTGVGLALALSVSAPFGAALGGAVLGLGIAAMHYTGMEAFEIAGHIRWDPVLVAASLVCGALFGGAALPVALAAKTMRGRMTGALLLLLAICGHHFVAMGAVTIVPDPSVAISESAIPARWLAVGIALASLAILALAGAALALDIRDRRQLALERERLHSLANAAVEGLLVCRDDRIVNANKSFGRLVGLDAGALVGIALSRFLPESATRVVLAADLSDQPVEAELTGADGSPIPVELIVRPVTYGNHPHYAVAVRDLRARRKAEGQIAFLAHHDPLTGLANRASFRERFDQELKRAKASGGRLAVLCLDLDRFKEINDALGHPVGDALLRAVAGRLGSCVREVDTVARLGSDEFAILLADTDRPDDAVVLARRIVEVVGAPYTLDGQRVSVGVSIGICFAPGDGTSSDKLIKNADVALDRAKADGRGTWRFFEIEMDIRLQARRALELDLREALAKGEFKLHYQAIYDFRARRITGFEALVRWIHPTRGLVSPGDFIAVAEEIGLIVPLGAWCLKTACREAMRWPDGIKVAVNVSAVQFRDEIVVDSVREALAASRLPPERLELEITESVLLKDNVATLATLNALRGLGVRIAMDDFGTGYSSLSYLRSFPFDKIKIDQSFVRDITPEAESCPIVRAVIGLGAGLGMRTTGEGIETQTQFDRLAAEGCDEGQGYFIAKPGPSATIHETITRWSGAHRPPPRAVA